MLAWKADIGSRASKQGVAAVALKGQAKLSCHCHKPRTAPLQPGLPSSSAATASP